jgi:APA family basic amino acid/polyamine antiporter
VSEQPTLRRVISLPVLVLYGLGTTIGAGIYALIGKTAAVAGVYAPMSFVVAALLAGLSALSFAELSARFPTSAGEARYVREGLRSNALALLVGLMVVASGAVSAAAVSNGFAGYFQDLTGIPQPIGVAGIVVLLGALAAWGIGESVGAAALITVVEIGGLLLIIWAGGGSLVEPAPSLGDFIPPLDAAAWGGVFVASFLAFYAFIGFEDMVNVAEETVDATRTLPLAIVVTILVTLVLYVAVAVVAVRAVPIAELAASDAPLSLLFARAAGWSGVPISLIAVLATINGALIQMVMAARVLYGLANQGQLPKALGRVHPATRTPLLATALVTAVVLALAVPLPIARLAQTTSLIVLTVFAFVNLALWRLKRREPRAPGAPNVPVWVPIAGFVVSAGFVIAEAGRLLLT